MGRTGAVARTVIFTVLVPGTVTVVIPSRLAPADAEFSLRGFGVLGVLLIALGAALYFWCAWDFAWTGRGTPAPVDPPRLLVARGPYRVVRNPMYAGVLFVLFGESIAFASGVLAQYALGAWLLFHLLVVFYEEPTLGRKFGASYEDYRRAVPRWIPRLIHRRHPR